MKPSKIILIATIVGATVLGGIAGTVMSASADGTHQGFAVNPSGETFGSARDAVSPESEPTLIEAEATNGRNGYVRGSDLRLPATTPEDNIRNTEIYLNGFTVPVYESDGATQIGEFFVGGGQIVNVNGVKPE